MKTGEYVYVLLEGSVDEGERLHGVYRSLEAAKRAASNATDKTEWREFESATFWEAFIRGTAWTIELRTVEGD